MASIGLLCLDSPGRIFSEILLTDNSDNGGCHCKHRILHKHTKLIFLLCSRPVSYLAKPCGAKSVDSMEIGVTKIIQN